jgi:hypothetical protein
LEAAHTYQQWGGERPSYYLKAMKGARDDKKTGQNLIWGWGPLANRLARSPDPKHKALYHEARYYLAECRFKLAMSQGGEERRQGLADAEHDIAVTYKLSPDLGDRKSKDRFDRLLKDIQQARGEQRTGLKQLDAKAEQSAAN